MGGASSESGEGIGLAVVVLGAFGPPLAALVLVWLSGGAIRDWIPSVLRIRVSYRWYAIAFLLPVAMVAIGTPFLFVLEGDLVVDDLPVRIVAFLPTVLFMCVLGGGQEELGWRGFALPRLERRLHPTVAALALGTVWAVWHLPLFSLPGSSQFGASFLLYGFGVVGLSIPVTWLFNRSASASVATLLHGSYNAALLLYPVPLDQLGGAAGSSVLAVGAVTAWLVGLVLIVATRGDLGYDPSRLDTRRYGGTHDGEPSRAD